MKNTVSRISASLTAAVMLMSAGAMSAQAYTQDTTIFPTYKNETPSSGCIVVGMIGRYNADIQDAIDRINEIRLEACKEGVPNPSNPSKKLTKSDYVPIKWSAQLESVARVRAAEASIRIDHTRPCDDWCFSITTDELFCCGEVLAWNGSENIVTGIEQFYGEKSDWVDQNDNAVTGHYTQMIDPANTYVGMSSFSSDSAIYHNCVAGRFGQKFSSGDSVDETRGSSVENCIASVIVNKSYISNPRLKLVGGSSSVGVKKAARYELRASSSIDGGNAEVLLFKGIKWTSSDSSVAAVDAYGRVVGKKAGKATITGSCAGFKASKTISVIDNDVSNSSVSISGKVYAYTGSRITPAETVTLNGKTLTKGTDYTVTYSNNLNTGKATAVINGRGSYTGSKTVYFYIKPAKQKIVGISKPAAKKLKVRWAKVAAQADGYQIFYSLKKSFSPKKSITVVGGSKSAKTITGLASKRRYYIKVRAYKVIDGKRYYGVCSPVKYATTK